MHSMPDDAQLPCFELVRRIAEVADWLAERAELGEAGYEQADMREVLRGGAAWLRDIAAGESAPEHSAMRPLV